MKNAVYQHQFVPVNLFDPSSIHSRGAYKRNRARDPHPSPYLLYLLRRYGVVVGVEVLRGGFVGVSVGVSVGVPVGVSIGVSVGVTEGVFVEVLVAVSVGVFVGGLVGVLVGVGHGGGCVKRQPAGKSFSPPAPR